MTVRVVTDSSGVVPRSWAEEAGLVILPLELGWPDGRTGPGDIGYAEYVREVERHGGSAQTAAPSPGVYQELLSELLVDADAVMVVCPAAELSATYGNALLAARNIEGERVRVLDARTAAAGQGLVAVQAARAASTGAGLDAVVDRALDVAARVEIWATLTRLDQLRRSGRVPAIAAIGAGALGLQPIVRYAKKGSPTVVGVTRSADRAADRLFRAWERTVARRAALELVALHCARADHAESLCRRVLARFPKAKVAVTEVTAGLAAHTGPGLLGVAWWWEPLP